MVSFTVVKLCTLVPCMMLSPGVTIPLLRPLFYSPDFSPSYALNREIVLHSNHSPIPICDHRFQIQTPYIFHIKTTLSRNGMQCVSDQSLSVCLDYEAHWMTWCFSLLFKLWLINKETNVIFNCLTNTTDLSVTSFIKRHTNFISMIVIFNLAPMTHADWYEIQ